MLSASSPWIVNAALIVLGASIAALAPALRAVLPARRATVVAAVLFAVCGIVLALTGVFRLDCALSSHACLARFDAGKLSWHTSVHVWAGLAASLAVLLTPFAIARALWPSPASAAALAAGAFGVALAITGEIAYAASAPDGISERLQLLALHAWIVVVAGGVLYALRPPPKVSPLTPLPPRDFFAGSWAGEGEVSAWRPVLDRFIRARFMFTREARFLSDEVWMFDDRATFPGGFEMSQRLICQLEPSGRIRVTADSVPGGCEVLLDDRGYRLTPYRYLVEIGPLRFPVRCREEHRVEDDGTLVSSVRARWLGMPVAKMQARAQRTDRPAPGETVGDESVTPRHSSAP